MSEHPSGPSTEQDNPPAVQAARDGREDVLPLVTSGFMPYLLNRIVNRLNLNLKEALRPLGMTQPRWRVLALLQERDGLPMGEMAVYTVMEQSSLSRVIDQMERDGLARRQPREGDARVTEVHITERGRAVFREVAPVALAQAERAMEGFTPEERQALSGYLRRLLDNVRLSPFR